MSLVVKQKEGREPTAAGTYHAVCCGIVDLGTQPQKNPKYRPRQEVLLTWELVDELIEYEKDGVKHSFKKTINRYFPASLGSSTKPTEFCKLLQSWRGRPFTAAELEGFDLKTVLGANCLLTVVHNDSNGTIYANVGSVSPLVKGTPKRTADTPALCFTLSDIPEGDLCVWPREMPEWLREKIMKSTEYEQRFGGHGSEGHGYQPPGDPGFGDDDIPF